MDKAYAQGRSALGGLFPDQGETLLISTVLPSVPRVKSLKRQTGRSALQRRRYAVTMRFQNKLLSKASEMKREDLDAYDFLNDIPTSDNTSESLAKLREINLTLRSVPWPSPFDETRHGTHLGDARDLSWIPDGSVHLVVTSPPYWTLKDYRDHPSQMGHIEDYEEFLKQLDLCWAECARVLAPGGRICCVVGDVCLPRKKAGRHYVMPLHSDIQVRARKFGLDSLSPIYWNKIANGVTEAAGNGAGFYGKPYQPGAIVKNDVEFILFMRKGGTYRTPSLLQKALSMLTKDEMQAWWQPIWTDVRGASTRNGHPAPYPVELAERLIRMFSFAGDVVLDPFAGTCSTAIAAYKSGRHSISNEIDPEYLRIGTEKLQTALNRPMLTGASRGTLISM
ncbi:site-specific DNA-methyltransferase [Paraburkholderia sp. RAU2J]|uniref:DNA-methyltransferase n=1 Tax=Paraburkholderia sp. RAU2J TaxID=1938810 RepID=UPI0018F64F66|nr:site-specific DNA-methyltransferase [Paraburkholderia sp. RAU2J]